MSPFDRLRAAGVSVWLDTLSRELLEDGDFARMQDELAVTGATSNPTIFATAICGSGRYDSQLGDLLARGVTDPRELFLELALADVKTAAQALRPVHEASGGADGFVSFECTPDVAYDTAATIAQARDLWNRLDAPNVMIKVPGTAAGVAAVEQLTAEGVNVNVTLLFAVERYAEVVEAYLRGLERRARAGEPLAGIASVASFFVSRVDAQADRRLAEDSPLRGRTGIANAHAAYRDWRAAFDGSRWHALAALGAAPQRPLWASTATKDDAYRDVMYLEQLALPDTILTVPAPTLRAFADHGSPDAGVLSGSSAAADELSAAATAVDLASITADLERAGVEAFCGSYRELLACIEKRARGIEADGGRGPVAILH